MHRNGPLRWAGVAAVIAALSGFVIASPATASADATDDYPIPNRILKTGCTAEREPTYVEHSGASAVF